MVGRPVVLAMELPPVPRTGRPMPAVAVLLYLAVELPGLQGG